MNLSKTVTFKEAVRSNTAIKFGISNVPNDQQIKAMIDTCEHIVDSVRNKYGDAVDVSSMFRSEALNKKIGGAKGSQHCLGEAVDLDSKDDNLNLEIFNFIKDNLVFDQLILEAPNAAGVPSWVHCSFVSHPKQNRGQVLVYLASTKKYIPFGEWARGMI